MNRKIIYMFVVIILAAVGIFVGFTNFPGEDLQGVGPEDNSVSWSIPLSGRPSSPVSHPKGVSVATENSILLVENGEINWEYGKGTSDFHLSVSPGGSVFFASEENKVYALYENGNVNWVYNVGAAAYSVTTGSDGAVYFASMENRIYALGKDAGLKWIRDVGGLVSGLKATDGTVYISSWDNSVSAFNENGSVQWTYDTDAFPHFLKVSDGNVYFSSGEDKIRVLDEEGDPKWIQGVEGKVEGVAVGEETVYVGHSSMENGFLTALEKDGDQKWSTELEGNVSPVAVDDRGTVYASLNTVSEDFRGSIVAINSDGSAEWTFSKKNGLFTNPTLGEGVLYTAFYGENSRLYAF